MEVCPPKCFPFATHPALRRCLNRDLHMGGQALQPCKLGARILGAHGNSSRKPVKGCHHERYVEATARAQRMSWLPLRMGARDEAGSAAVVPLAQYGCLAAEGPARRVAGGRQEPPAGRWPGRGAEEEKPTPQGAECGKRRRAST